MFKHLQARFKNLFSSTISLPSTAPHQPINPNTACVKLHFWPPQLESYKGVLFSPLFSRFIKGSAGHVSMTVNFSDRSTKYFSIWPDVHDESGVSDQQFKPIQESKNIETDILSEGGRDPTLKLSL